MSAPDTATLLDQVRQAISDLVTSGVAEWGDGQKRVTIVDLDRLRLMEDQLSRRLAAETGGNFRLAAPFNRR